MLDGASQDVRYRFNPAMRMPGEAGKLIAWIVIAEIIQQKERIEIFRLAKSESPLQADAGAFQCRLGSRNLFHWTQ